MEKFVNRCDITGKGMNAGWVWGDGTFYTSTQEVTIAELRSDIKDGAYDFDEMGAERMLEMTDDELLQYAYDNDVLYYTEWDDEINKDNYDCYYDEDGNEYEF
jgi:hypothetical protein